MVKNRVTESNKEGLGGSGGNRAMVGVNAC